MAGRMTNPPPSRTADKIIIRLPDGMRDRLHQRAEANGRSMTAEVVGMLEQVLEEPTEQEMGAMAHEAMRVVKELEYAQERVAASQSRLQTLREEIRTRLGSELGDRDPIEYAMRMYLVQRSRARKAMDVRFADNQDDA